MHSTDWTIDEQDQLIAEAIDRDEPRLRSFIRNRVLDTGDAEDVLQDVFYELLQAYRLMKPAEQITAWLFRVARNRITDLFRRKKTVSLNEPIGEETESFEDLLPSPDAGPDAIYARGVLYDALGRSHRRAARRATGGLYRARVPRPQLQGAVRGIGHTRKTRCSRAKRYAVLHLRERLREIGNITNE